MSTYAFATADEMDDLITMAVHDFRPGGASRSCRLSRKQEKVTWHVQGQHYCLLEQPLGLSEPGDGVELDPWVERHDVPLKIITQGSVLQGRDVPAIQDTTSA